MESFQKLIKRLLLLIGIFTMIIISVIIALYNYETKNIEYNIIEQWDPNEMIIDNLNVPLIVKQGYLFVSESSKHMGPLAKNDSLRFSGNNLSCTNCHLNGGTLSGSASWIGIIDRFPQFGGRANKLGTIQDRINGCMERSMNGKKLSLKSKQMNAIVAYMDWLGEDLPKLNSKIFKGYPAITIPKLAVDLEFGKNIYIKECTTCHGKNGQGIRYLDFDKGYQYPPLWGNDSYNDGAGMNRVITAAAFIKNNMPFEQASWENPKLTDEQSYHVAGYINSFSRPHKNNPEADYPDKKLKPVSTPYGPWEDDFSAKQHKFGPFAPIISFYKKKYNIEKTK